MTIEEIEEIKEKIALEGSVAYANGYTYFIHKDTGEVVRMDTKGRMEIMPQQSPEADNTIMLKANGKPIFASYDANTGEFILPIK